MVSAAEEPPSRTAGMSGLAKGLAIIEAFAIKPALTIAEAAKASGTSRAAARRCLLTLADLGYVEFDGKLYHPLPRLLRLGGGTSRMLPLPQAAQPVLDRVRDRLQESVSLAILDGDDVLFVARAESARIVSTAVRIGAAMPAFIAATGRVLLAALPEPEIELRLSRLKLDRRTAKTVVMPPKLRKVIEDARAQGYAMSNEEIELGLCAIAVPVIDRNNRTVASISVSASSARITVAHMVREFLPVLRRNAEILGNAL